MERAQAIKVTNQAVAHIKQVRAGPNPQALLKTLRVADDDMSVLVRTLRTAKGAMRNQGIDTNEWDTAIKALQTAMTEVDGIINDLER